MTCDFRCPLDLCLLVVQAPCVQLACLTLLFIFRLCFACMLFPDCYCLTGVHWIPYYLITWPPYAHTHSQELSRSVTFWSCERHLCSLWQNTFKLGQMEFVSPFFFSLLVFPPFFFIAPPFWSICYACGRLSLLARRQKYQKFPF